MTRLLAAAPDLPRRTRRALAREAAKTVLARRAGRWERITAAPAVRALARSVARLLANGARAVALEVPMTAAAALSPDRPPPPGATAAALLLARSPAGELAFNVLWLARRPTAADLAAIADAPPPELLALVAEPDFGPPAGRA